MTAHAYTPDPGGWLLLCRPDLVLGVDLASDDPRGAGLWALVEGGARSPALLDELTSGGLSRTPSFVLLDRATRTSARVFARGEVALRVGDGDPISGAKVSSWAESTASVPDVVAVTIGRPASGIVPLPISSGAVRASGVSADFGVSVSALSVSAASTPAPSAPTRAVADAPAVDPEAPDAVPEPAPAMIEPPTFPGTTLVSEATAVPDSGRYDDLFGETVVRGVEEAAIRAGDDDIEEHTVVADLSGVRAQRRAERRGHPSHAAESATLSVELSTGGIERLDQTLIVGRAPSASRVAGGNLPRLITMTTPNHDISRNHVEIVQQGDDVTVTDLHSKNGTMIVLPDQSPQKLRPGVPTTVIVGTIIDLGDGATLTVQAAR